MAGGPWWMSRPLATRARDACRRVVALAGVVAWAGVGAGAGVVRWAWLFVRGIVRVLSACSSDATSESVPNVHLGRQPWRTA
jgi:hypothetical protein